MDAADTLDPSTATLIIGLLLALLGALAGTAGFSMLVVGRQNRRLAALAEHLTEAQDEGALIAIDARRISDDRLRAAFQALADRVADTWRLATIDPLTGIANRQAVLDLVDQELARAGRYRHPISVILVDLDHFKRLNDSQGHAAGDRVLRHIGQLLASNVRAIDTAGRYGGEEFLVVLPETDVDAAASVAEKLRRIVAGSPLRLDSGEMVTVTMSAGVAGGPGELIRPDVLVRDADAALYSAKALGRDQVYVFRETGDDGTVRRAPIQPEARHRALGVGREAMAAAQDQLLRTLAGRASWAGKPSTLIAEASVALGRAIDLPVGELERIRTASLLHDLGKLAIPDEILSKPGDLAASEWRVVAEHPKIGQVVLEQAGALRDAATIVLHHHEWYDGRGYPHGLAGGEIPIGARIVSIVDAYEAMIAGRPYRTAIPHEAAIAELRRQAGIQFDPELVELFAIVFETGVPWPPETHDHTHAEDEDEHEHDRVHDHPDAPAPVAAEAELAAPAAARGTGRGPRTARARSRSTAELHDSVHESRRRAI